MYGTTSSCAPNEFCDLRGLCMTQAESFSAKSYHPEIRLGGDCGQLDGYSSDDAIAFCAGSNGEPLGLCFDPDLDGAVATAKCLPLVGNRSDCWARRQAPLALGNDSEELFDYTYFVCYDRMPTVWPVPTADAGVSDAASADAQ